MKRLVSLLVLTGLFLASPAFAADPIVGTWKLNVAKSKFIKGSELTAGTRVYTEASGLYTLDQKLTGADGKEKANQVQYRDGKEEKRQRYIAESVVLRQKPQAQGNRDAYSSKTVT